MNHSFHPSLTDNTKCAHCKYDAISHTEAAICESCGLPNTVDIVYGNMLMCKDCQIKEKEAWNISQSPANIEARIQAANVALESSRKIDDGITIRTDLFNAATTAIVDLCKAVDDNPEITNKPYAKAEELKRRFDHYQEVIFESQSAILDAGNNQRAIQTYLNQLANTLRAEEREKLKIADINYRPTVVKPTKPISNKIKPKKLDKTEVRKYANELGITEFILHTFALQNGGDLEKAVMKLRKSIADAKEADKPKPVIKEEIVEMGED
jgi:hypothetical protein